MKNKNDFESDFTENISLVITKKIETINSEYSVILRDILPKLKADEKINNFKLTDERLLLEIYNLFGDDCISDRTLKNIKYGHASSSAFNISIVIYSLNSLIDLINDAIIRYNSSKEKLLNISFNDIMEPLKG